MAKKGRQVAAIPIRRRRDGRLQVLLVTSRDTGRWVVPKGWPWPGHTDAEAAGREAWEEAGIVGNLSSDRIGTFRYRKRIKGGEKKVEVSVYLLDVKAASKQWPEKPQRRRRWFGPNSAAELVHEPELKSLILALDVSK